ncbi:MAG TPA: FAD-dependent oxidoreductase, partial [Anaerovoracaceae bacterium]|nr:FAD-dependent oxidoreductase [Anaerovoracaceae bacterium]
LQYAISLGVTITTNFAPKEMIGSKKVEFAVFKGRDGVSEAKVAADTVVFAIGQAPEDFTKIAPVKVTEKGTIAANAKGKTSVTGIYAAGDAAHGGKTVVEAVAAGKEAAAEIISYLEKKEGVK